MSFTVAVAEAISGKQARYVHVGTSTMVNTLVARHGSNVRAGAAIGVSEATIRRWRKGQAVPRAGTREALVAGYRQLTMDPGREANLRAGRIELLLTQNGPDGNPERSRLIKGSGMALTPGAVSAAVDAYLAGDDAGAAEAIYEGIQDGFYKDFIVPDYDEPPDFAEFDPYGLY